MQAKINSHIHGSMIIKFNLCNVVEVVLRDGSDDKTGAAILAAIFWLIGRSQNPVIQFTFAPNNTYYSPHLTSTNKHEKKLLI